MKDILYSTVTVHHGQGGLHVLCSHNIPVIHVLCNFRSIFYVIDISANLWYLNKPDEDWYWPVEISQPNSISRCLISPCKSLLDCNVFNLIYFDWSRSFWIRRISRARSIVHGFLQCFFFFIFNSTFYQSVFCVGNIANEKNLRKNNSIYFLQFYLFIGVSFSRWNFLLLLGLKTIKNSSGQMRQLYAYVAHESTLNHKLNRNLSFPSTLKYF